MYLLVLMWPQFEILLGYLLAFWDDDGEGDSERERDIYIPRPTQGRLFLPFSKRPFF